MYFRRPGQGLLLALVSVCRPAPADEGDIDLAAVAHATDRPVECGGGDGNRLSRWERARTPGLGAYCDALAGGFAALRTDPRAALAAADRAARLRPESAAPLLLRGRAEARLAAWAESFEAFERARKLEPRAAESPGALLDHARAARSSGHPDVALDCYRALSPRAGFLVLPGERERALAEAGLLALSLGEEHLAEAASYLVEARRSSKGAGISDYVVAALALARDRQGRPAEAGAIAAEASGPFRLDAEFERAASGKGEAPLFVPPGELAALVAILAESHDVALAKERWQAYLAAPVQRPAAFEARALARLEALRRGRGKHR